LPNYAEDEVGEGLGRMACQGSVLEGQGWWQYRTDHQFIPALGPVLVLHRITAAYYRGERASVDVLSETWSWVLSVVGWDNLTPQRHRVAGRHHGALR
jgi:hypothetical protein